MADGLGSKRHIGHTGPSAFTPIKRRKTGHEQGLANEAIRLTALLNEENLAILDALTVIMAQVTDITQAICGPTTAPAPEQTEIAPHPSKLARRDQGVQIGTHSPRAGGGPQRDESGGAASSGSRAAKGNGSKEPKSPQPGDDPAADTGEASLELPPLCRVRLQHADHPDAIKDILEVLSRRMQTPASDAHGSNGKAQARARTGAENAIDSRNGQTHGAKFSSEDAAEVVADCSDSRAHQFLASKHCGGGKGAGQVELEPARHHSQSECEDEGAGERDGHGSYLSLKDGARRSRYYEEALSMIENETSDGLHTTHHVGTGTAALAPSRTLAAAKDGMCCKGHAAFMARPSGAAAESSEGNLTHALGCKGPWPGTGQLLDAASLFEGASRSSILDIAKWRLASDGSDKGSDMGASMGGLRARAAATGGATPASAQRHSAAAACAASEAPAPAAGPASPQPRAPCLTDILQWVPGGHVKRGSGVPGAFGDALALLRATSPSPHCEAATAKRGLDAAAAGTAVAARACKCGHKSLSLLATRATRADRTPTLRCVCQGQPGCGAAVMDACARKAW
jgi:hypothetical protein